MNSIKTILARTFHPLERWFDRVKRRVPKDPVIEGYLGFATPAGIVVRGRVLARKQNRDIAPNDSKIANFMSMILLFATDEIAGIELVCGASRTTTDEEGYFSFTLPPNGAQGWVSHEVKLAAFPDVTATVESLVPDPTASFGIISDIDDTIMATGAYNIFRNLWTSMTGNAFTRHVFPDAKALLDGLHDGKNPVYFVSSSPWNMYGFLQHVFKRNGIIHAPMFLRDLGLSETQFVTGTHEGHKSAAITEILNAAPGLKFVLIGDTGQKDATVYLDAFKKHPGRILAVILREPGSGPNEKSLSAIADMKNAGLDVQTGKDFSSVKLVGTGDQTRTSDS